MRAAALVKLKVFSPLVVFLLVCLIQTTTPTKTSLKTKRQVTLTFQQLKLPVLFFKSLKIIEDVGELWNYLLQNPDSDIKSILFKKKEHTVFERILEISSKVTHLEGEVKIATDSTVERLLQAFPKVVRVELNLHDLTMITNHVSRPESYQALHLIKGINFSFGADGINELIAKKVLQSDVPLQNFYKITFVENQMRQYLILGYNNMTSEESPLPLDPNPDVKYTVVDSADSYHMKQEVLEEMSNRIMKREADSKWLLERITLTDLANWATGLTYNSLQSLLRRMNDLVTRKEPQNLFELIHEASEETKSSICNLKQSPHQTLYNLYNTIALAELKGNVILQFSYMILKMYNKGNFTVEAEIAQSNYEKYAKEKIEAIRNALSKANRSLYKCDPPQFVEGITYTKLTKLLQGYIENEVNLNPYGTCRENCKYYIYTEYNGCFKNQFCAQQPPCKGKVLNCRFVDSDMNICTSSNSERRYEWVEYENGKVLGNKGVCQTKNLFKVDSWWRYLFWHCSYCLCLCDDTNEESDRYFNLRDVTSDIENNKIVTGLRIVKNNQIIHLQIQQGVLTPLGVVNKTSLSWKPVSDYSIDDNDVENNVDYHTMNWMERSIDTDEVYGPPEHVVTGIRLRKIGTHLNLEVRVTPINFKTGEVYNAEHSYWLGNDNTDASSKNPRTEILLTDPDIPIRNGPHTLNSKHDQYVQFQPTSFDTDAGQTTVPFLDSQALTSQGFPLSGIGLIHRGKLGSGGFIAPKLISYDYMPHLRNE